MARRHPAKQARIGQHIYEAEQRALRPMWEELICDLYPQEKPATCGQCGGALSRLREGGLFCERCGEQR